MADRGSHISVRKLREVPDAGLSGSSTPTERLALVATLTRETWALTGRALPTYARREAPVAVRPLRPIAPPANG